MSKLPAKELNDPQIQHNAWLLFEHILLLIDAKIFNLDQSKYPLETLPVVD